VKDQRASTAPGATGPLLTRDDDKYNGGLIGVTVPMGAGLIKAAYSKVKYDNDLGSAAGPSRDASVDKIAVGYEYNLSKRTAVYATAALVRAKNAQNNPAVMGVATGSAAFLSTGAGTTGYAPARSTGYDVGIRHAF
jgi:predicted porin